MNSKDAVKKIENIDEKLSILRESWIDSKKEKKSAWFEKINAALDERLEHMKIRDEK